MKKVLWCNWCGNRLTGHCTPVSHVCHCGTPAEELREHWEKVKALEEQYRCSICLYTTDTPFNMHLHLGSHAELIYKCLVRVVYAGT